MVTNTANRPSHDRVKQSNHHYKQINWTMSTVFCVTWTVTAIWTSRTSGTSRKCPGKHWDTSRMTLWHAGTLLAHGWHAAGTVDRPMAQAHYWWRTHSSLTLGRLCWHTNRMMWSVYKIDGDGVCMVIQCWSSCWSIFWVRSGSKPVHTQKTGPTP